MFPTLSKNVTCYVKPRDPDESGKTFGQLIIFNARAFIHDLRDTQKIRHEPLMSSNLTAPDFAPQEIKFSLREENDQISLILAVPIWREDGEGLYCLQRDNPGVYYDWDSCNEQVRGFSGASFRSYSSGREAEIAWEEKLGQVQGRRYRSLDSPSMSHEQCSTPTIGSPSSLTTVMPRSDRFLEGVILGSATTMVLFLRFLVVDWKL
ncbi:hypothetical protein RIF29_25282 [Crotalaria pallida]|uniref:Ribonuclease H1 N-terminal domain-containing protein n=1 Tax=Crotalaria pallida TaxID=3830 RepID=A0AAN9EM48_CROPI